jgi:Ca-activated chloride channel family protein
VIKEYNEDRSLKGYKQDREGNIVKTRLNEKTLERIAMLTEGAYYPSSVGETELDDIYDRISQMEKKELQSKRFAQYEDRFQYFLLWAILALAAEVAISDRKRIKKEWTGRFD